ncbi:MAG: hypothetical protein KDE09_12195 [Anaerolineales bacterium]|nr:hypothetical protein [Anaerolineales bacterium]
MAKDDDKNKRVLRDTTKPEHRPSWGASRDNAPKGAAAINWGDRGVPAPSPGGTGSRKKTGLFKGGVKAPARAPEPEKSPSSPKKITGLFREQRGDDRATQILKGGADRKDTRLAQDSPNATIQPDDRKPVFRRKGRDDDLDRGR